MIPTIANEFRSFLLLDQICDYIPIVSTATNLTTLFQKYVYLSDVNYTVTKKNCYYHHIHQKSFFRCVILLVPIIGNIYVIVSDLAALYYNDCNPEIKPPVDKNIALEFQDALFPPRQPDEWTISKENSSIDQDEEKTSSSDTSIQNWTEANFLMVKLVQDQALNIECNYSCWSSLGPEIHPYNKIFTNDKSLIYAQQEFDVIKYINWLNKRFTREQDKLYFVYNGIDRLYIEYDRIRYSSSVDLIFAAEYPEIATGLLGIEAGLKSPEMPNWSLTTTLIKCFLQKMEKLQRIENAQTILSKHSSSRCQFVGICDRMSKLFSTLNLLSNQIVTNIECLLKIHKNFCESIQKDMQIYENCKNEHMLRVQKLSAENFEWNHLQEKLIGAKKFFLRDELFAQEFHSKINPLKNEIYQQCEKSTLMRIACLASSVIYGSLGYCFSGALGTLAALLPSGVMNAEKRRLQNLWHHEITKIKTPYELINKPRLDCNPMRKWGMSGYYKDGFKKSQLVLDLNTREIQWINRSSNDPHQVLADIEVLPEQPANGLFVNVKNYFKSGVLQIIGAQRNHSQNYDALLQQLIRDYRSCVTAIIENHPIHSENALVSLASGTVISGLQKGSLPLVFPKALLQELDKHIQQIQHDWSLISWIPFIPFYDFSTETGELNIVYKTPHASVENSSILGKFTIAQFDPLTIQAFSTDLTSNSQKFDPSEFLLQALYGGLVSADLGLPGKGSVRLKSGLISPQETAFQGCYFLWEKTPNRAVVYNSKQFDGSQQEIDALTTEELVMTPCRNYRRILKTIIEEKEKLISKQKEYRRVFLVLRALVKLFSKTPWELVQQRLAEFGLVPPEQLQSLLDHPSVRPMDPATITDLKDQLLSNPSKNVLEVRNLEKQLESINQWVKTTPAEKASSESLAPI